MRRILAIVLLTVLLTVTAAQLGFAGDVVLIANNDVPNDTLDIKTVRKIFQGKKTRWQNDANITPVILQKGPTHEVFVKTILKKSVFKFTAYWKQAVFTGMGTPPRSLATEEELIHFVAETHGAIGYVSKNFKINGVKIIVLKH